MVDLRQHQYRKTDTRLQILLGLQSAREILEMVARAMERDGHTDHAHKTRNVAQSASARRDLMEQQWEIDDNAKREARKGKAKK